MSHQAITATMAKPFKNYINRYRRLRGLSQRELAPILGCQSGKTVSRYEQSTRQPNLEVALRLAWFLDVPPEKLWPGFRQEIIEQAMRPCQILLQKMSKQEETKKRKLKVAYLKERLGVNLTVVENDAEQ